MVDTVARILSFISLRLRGRSGTNTRLLTDPHKRKSYGMMSGDLEGHSSRGRPVFWIERPIQHCGRCSLRNFRTSRWKWAAESRLAAKWSRRILPIAAGKVTPSACPDTWSLYLCSPQKRMDRRPVCVIWHKRHLLWANPFHVQWWHVGFQCPRCGHYGDSPFRLNETYFRHWMWGDLQSHYFFMRLLILQQVQAVMAHLNPPPDAPDRGLRQALLTSTSPCRFPGTSLKGDTKAIRRFLEHTWPRSAHSCRDAPFLLHPFIPAVNIVNIRKTWWGFLYRARNNLSIAVAERSLAKSKKSRPFPVESPWLTFVPPGGANANSDFQAPLFPRNLQEKESIVTVASTSRDDILQMDCDELDYRIDVCHGTQWVHTEHL